MNDDATFSYDMIKCDLQIKLLTGFTEYQRSSCHGVMVSWCHSVIVSSFPDVIVSWCHTDLGIGIGPPTDLQIKVVNKIH